MADLVAAKRAPFGSGIENGSNYWRCVCGMSREQQFCDDSQKGAGTRPSNYSADNSKAVYF